MMVARISPGSPPQVKPTTNLIHLMGHLAKRSVIQLPLGKAKDFSNGLDARLEGEEADAGDGFVVVRYEGFSLGCGLKQGATLRCLVPKAKRARLKFL